MSQTTDHRRDHRVLIAALSGFGALGIVTFTIATLFFQAAASQERLPPAPATMSADLGWTLPPGPTAVPAAPPPRGPAAATTPASEPCAPVCLVRIADSAAARTALAANGVGVSYASGQHLWAIAPIDALIPVAPVVEDLTLVANDPVTLPLYAVRKPDGADDALVHQSGTVLDQVGDQFIVELSVRPPDVNALIDAGYAVEKLAPATTAWPQHRAELPTIENPGDLVRLVSTDELEQTILTLQGMSSNDGTGIGTRYYAEPGNAMAAEYLYERLNDYGLNVWYEEFLTYDGLLAVNVVGEIPGDDPSEVYLVLAHFDSISTPAAVAPGADDNASGVAATLEMARILSGYELAHPVRFVFLNGEEVDLQGARAFAAQAVADHTPIAGAFNLDAIDSGRNGNQLILNGDPQSAWLQDLLGRLNDGYRLEQSLSVHQAPDIVADDNILREAGIPTILVARELYGESDVHHTPDDVFANLSLPHARVATQLVLLGVAALVAL